MKELNKKLHLLQSEVGAIAKDETNPFFKSKYFDINGLIEHLEPLLSKHKLLLLQPIITDSVETRIICVDTNEMVSSTIRFNLLDDPQKMGSAITYYRRYTLQSLLGLRAEDDDANKASGKQGNTTKPQPTQWLNLTNKDGSKTKAYENIAQAIADGSEISLSSIKAKYKVSNVTADILSADFGIV